MTAAQQARFTELLGAWNHRHELKVTDAPLAERFEANLELDRLRRIARAA